MAGCIGEQKKREKKCTEYRDEGYNSCKSYRDDGYNSCDNWDKDCCDWAPCSWACEAFTWICRGWVWVSNIVCVAWEWIKNVVCVAWNWVTTIICIGIDAIVTAVGAIIETVESIVGWVLSAVGWVIEFVLSIPIIGRAIGWVLAAAQTIWWEAAGIIDTIASLIGIRPEKKLRVCTIILSDENGRPTIAETAVIPMLQRAVDVYKEEANIRLIPLGAFQYSSGFSGNRTVTADWITVSDDRESARTLDLGGEGETLATDLVEPGSTYNKLAMMHCYYGSWRKVVGYGSSITVLFIRSLEEGVARSLGPLTDYIVLGGQQGIDTTVVAHEMGHCCYLLFHATDKNNLMYGTSSMSSPRGTSLSWWQTTVVRSSRHVTYF